MTWFDDSHRRSENTSARGKVQKKKSDGSNRKSADNGTGSSLLMKMSAESPSEDICERDEPKDVVKSEISDTSPLIGDSLFDPSPVMEPEMYLFLFIRDGLNILPALRCLSSTTPTKVEQVKREPPGGFAFSSSPFAPTTMPLASTCKIVVVQCSLYLNVSVEEGLR